MKLFPSPRIPTDKIPECRPHIKRGDHLRLYRFSPEDYKELAAVFNGPHPETGEELAVVDEAPEGALPNDLPSQPAVFAPDYAPEEIAEIARKLREAAGLPKEPTGDVANGKAQARRSSSASRGRTTKASSSRSQTKRKTKPKARAGK
jgi:Mn-containing catalase